MTETSELTSVGSGWRCGLAPGVSDGTVFGSTWSKGCAASGAVLELLVVAAVRVGRHRCRQFLTVCRRENASAARDPTHSAAPIEALRPTRIAMGAMGEAAMTSQ